MCGVSRLIMFFTKNKFAKSFITQHKLCILKRVFKKFFKLCMYQFYEILVDTLILKIPQSA